MKWGQVFCPKRTIQRPPPPASFPPVAQKTQSKAVHYWGRNNGTQPARPNRLLRTPPSNQHHAKKKKRSIRGLIASSSQHISWLDCRGARASSTSYAQSSPPSSGHSKYSSITRKIIRRPKKRGHVFFRTTRHDTTAATAT